MSFVELFPGMNTSALPLSNLYGDGVILYALNERLD